MSLLIRGVQVVNGKGEEPYKADVLVQKNIISAVGDLKKRETDRVIDGLGDYLAPGFIDVHNNADHYLSLFSNPAQENFIKQGITTIIGGHCGASLAPLLYGKLTAVRKWADPYEVNVDWHTVGELVSALNRVSIGLNFGTLVGHSTIRRDLVGDRARLIQRELDVFKGVLNRAMKEGAFGFSSGLGYLHGKNASQKEIRELIKIVSEYSGIYSVHLRDESSGLVESVKEVAKMVKGLGVKTIISHFRPIRGFEKQFEEALKFIGSTEGLYFDAYPYDVSVRPLYTLLPEWAQVENLEVMLERVRNRKTAELIVKDLAKGLKDTSGSDIIIAGVPHHEYLVGKNIGNIAENLGVSYAEALLHIMDITDLRAVVFYKDVNNEFLLKTLFHDKAFVASHSKGRLPGEFSIHERSINTFPKYLDLIAMGGILPIEEAVEKITHRPAKLFGIKNRGVIQEGYVADLVILGKNDYRPKQVIIGGRIFGEESTKGEILEHKP